MRLPAAHACARAASSSPQTRLLALDSPSFPALRARRDTYVDKTSAIADLLVSDEGMHRRTRAFFSRPRKFGKSLTLDTAATMLASGELPGVAPWPGRVPVDVDAVFGGLAVHTRLRARDPSLRGLLERPHFVVNVGLGEAMTGARLEGAIIARLARIAGTAFGGALKAEVAAALSTGDALEALVEAVPSSVPVALLVDEYDHAIIQDVSKGRWAAADSGVEALRSLFMATKAPDVGSRVERCLVTGVARFAQTSLFSGANNFVDLTDDPLLSRVLGFSEDEIRENFPMELKRLAAHEDEAITQLAHWYNGYCFDGTTSSFNPYGVLKALDTGKISERGVASGTKWLGLLPGAVLTSLAEELQDAPDADEISIEIADIEEQRVSVVPLLLQTGLLTFVAGTTAHCRPPNEFARRSLQCMVAKALSVPPKKILPLTAALSARDRSAFMAIVHLLVAKMPRTIMKQDPDGATKDLVRESTYHSLLFGALLAAAPHGVDVFVEVSVNVGIADIVVKFSGARPVVWIIEVGIYDGLDARAQDEKKGVQAQTYAAAFSEAELFCCAMVVQYASRGSRGPGAVLKSGWTQRCVEADGKVTWQAAPLATVS